MPFEGNPDWSSFYAGQAEILEYLKRTAAKYNLTKHFQLNTEIVETIWDEDSAKWKILLEHNGERKEDEADFLINGSGFLKQVISNSKRLASLANHVIQQVEMA